MATLRLTLEELEPRIAPGGLGTHGESNGNSGNEVSNGSSPQPSGQGGGGESNGNSGNEVSNGNRPEPSGG